MYKIADAEKVIRKVADTGVPPWRPISSRSAAKLLGVSIQVLANWRLREAGPPHQGPIKGKGNRTFYRPDEVVSWLSTLVGRPLEPWEFDRDWMAERGIAANQSSKAAIEWLIAELEPHIAKLGALAR